jgi:glycerophosphoryl diester phosphodiesterase
MGRPLILGHRGASAVAPENTLPAFRRARELGADGVELDVTLTRDGVPVVIHDDTVDRTTNGHGEIRRMTIAEVKHLDAGSWKGEQFRGETIPTLAEVFDGLADWLEPRASVRAPSGVVNVEIKSATLGTDGVERSVVNLISQRDLAKRVIISSFNPLALARVKGLNPELRLGLLYSQDEPIYLRRAWLRVLVGPSALHPEHTLINPAYMDWARRKRLEVNTWTVDEPEEARRLTGLGVTALITNRPDVVKQALV